MLSEIIKGLKEIHINNMFHRDFHPGNILLINAKCVDRIDVYISDMGLCGKIDNTDKTEIYGVMPYIAPEVLRGKYYTQSADIYSFGIIMYFAVTGRQPFANRAHDHCLVLDICNGIRPEINELEAPKCYIELMERCWDSNPDNRPNVTEIKKYIVSLYSSYKLHQSNANKIKKYIMYSSYKIYKQFEEVEKYRQKNIKKQSSTHPQAYYTSRLLNPFTKHLSQYINNNELSSKIIINKEDTYEETILSISLGNYLLYFQFPFHFTINVNILYELQKTVKLVDKYFEKKKKSRK
jgi:serine/threonine protein kinase